MRPWASTAFKKPATFQASCNATRCLHYTATQYQADDASNKASKSNPPPRNDRIARSRSAMSSLQALSSQSGPRRIQGLAGGVFPSGQGRAGGVHSDGRNVRSPPRAQPPTGNRVVRRVVRGTASPASAPSPTTSPLSPSRPPSGSAMVWRRAVPGRPQGRGNVPQRKPHRDQRPRPDKGSPKRRAQEEEEQEDDYKPGDGMPDPFVRYLLEQHDKHHGNKPFDPIPLTKEQLLGYTEAQLPPMPGSQPYTLLARHLDGTTTHRAEYSPILSHSHIKQDSRRLIAGELVKTPDEARTLELEKHANREGMQSVRDEAAKKLGVDAKTPIRFAELPESLRKAIQERVVAGRYELTTKTGKTREQELANNALKFVQSNSSYKAHNVARFMNAVEGLLEGKPRPMAPQLEVRR